MQFSKDSFYVALRDRLVVVNPGRTVTMNGSTRPAVVAVENQPVQSTPEIANVFYLSWGAARATADSTSGRRPRVAMECSIRYGTAGILDGRVDRGRVLAALDLELLQICSPHYTAKLDYTQAPSVALGTNIVWTRPELGEVSVADLTGIILQRVAKLTVHYFPEVNLP